MEGQPKDYLLPELTGDKTKDFLCQRINQSITDRADLLYFAFDREDSSQYFTGYQIGGVNYEMVPGDSPERTRCQLYEWISLGGQIEGTDYFWRSIKNKNKLFTNRTNLIMPYGGAEYLESVYVSLSNLKSIREELFLFEFGYNASDASNALVNDLCAKVEEAAQYIHEAKIILDRAR